MTNKKKFDIKNNLEERVWIHCGSNSFDKTHLDSFELRTHKLKDKTSENYISDFGSKYTNSAGLWASPVKQKGEINKIFTWKDWCIEEDYKVVFYKEKAFKFKIKSYDKILFIDSVKVLNNTLTKYGLPLADKEIEYPNYLNWETARQLLEKILYDYKGLYIRAGSNHILYKLFYGWDCDSICVFDENLIETNWEK